MVARTKEEQRAKNQAAQNKARLIQRTARKAEGKCIRCGDPAVVGRSYCEVHLTKQRLANNKWKASHPGMATEYARDSRERLKRETMNAYGGQCACCGETELVFLCIDHVNNDGNRHRRETFGNGQNKGGGAEIYAWLRKRKYPPGFQVLCCNCNFAKQVLGICPHRLTSN